MIRIAAILVVRNGAPTLDRVLSHLGANEIEVFAIDHGSVDATPAILERRSPRPIVEVTRVPFDGAHRWMENLGRKVELAQRLPHDWIIHVDADEIMESPREGESFRQMIERLDKEGVDAIDCDEFTFVPLSEDEDHAGGDFVTTMQRYYYMQSKSPKQRAVRGEIGSVGWAHSGGHRASMEEDLRIADEKIRLRHYIGTSLDDLRSQYLGRVFGAKELKRGWHHRRVATTPDFVVAPPADRLWNLESDGWRVDRPERTHLVLRQQKRFTLPQPSKETSSDRPPMPFVVGVGRSGTTLLRFMLDAHPDLAVTPETHWLARVLDVMEEEPENRPALRKALASHDAWKEMGFDTGQLDAWLSEHDSSDPVATLRKIYLGYARRHGAGRVGDKTPLHGLMMTRIARALPEARFIHIIRDGRDVAVSHRGLWFGPGEDARDAAIFWLWRIREMRQQAQFLTHYLEVRFEDLVTSPESTLRRVGDFIELPFDSRQLAPQARSRARLAELADRMSKGRLISANQRRKIHEHTQHPPDPSRLGRWRKEMTEEDRTTFERIAGNMLIDLGYELGER